MAGIIVGLILLALSLIAPKSFQTVRGAALDVTGPVAGSLREVVDTGKGIFTGAGNYWDAASQNAELKKQNRAMLQRMVEAKAIFAENAQLKATLDLREHERSTVATGRIVGSSFNSPRRFAILSAGSTDGVRIGMPVRSADGPAEAQAPITRTIQGRYIERTVAEGWANSRCSGETTR